MATEDGSKKKKKENFFKEKLLTPIVATAIAGLIATYISNYIAKQNYYDDVVERYTTKLREFVVSDKLNSLKAETAQLNEDIAYLEQLNKYASDNSKINLSGLLISKKLLVEEALLTKSEGDSLPSVKKENIQQLLEFVENHKREKEAELSQIRGLMNTATVNTLITLSSNDAFFPLFSPSSWLSNIPGFYGQNIKRRDILINALRLSELGIGNRDNGTAIFDGVLNGMIIGGYSLQSNAKIDLQKIDLSLAFLEDSKFTDVNLENAIFSYARLKNSYFTQSNLNGVSFRYAKMQKATFTNSSLHDSVFDNADLRSVRAISSQSNRICNSTFLFFFFRQEQGISCNQVDFRGSSFKEAILKEARFNNANFTGADFTDADLTNTYFKNANLTGADFTGAKLAKADFTNANLTNTKGLDLIGVNNEISPSKLSNTQAKFCNTTYNVVLPNTFKLFLDCKDADLSRQDISGLGVNGIGFNLAGVDLNNADLTNSNLNNTIGVTLDQLKIMKAKMCNTTLPNSEKVFVDCKGADLSQQDLSGVDLLGADLTGADLTNANLTNANLTQVKGIDLSKLQNVQAILCNTTMPNGETRNDDCPLRL